MKKYSWYVEDAYEFKYLSFLRKELKLKDCHQVWFELLNNDHKRIYFYPNTEKPFIVVNIRSQQEIRVYHLDGRLNCIVVNNTKKFSSEEEYQNYKLLS